MAKIEDNHPQDLKNNDMLTFFDPRSIIRSCCESFMIITCIGKSAIYNTNIVIINYKEI